MIRTGIIVLSLPIPLDRKQRLCTKSAVVFQLLLNQNMVALHSGTEICSLQNATCYFTYKLFCCWYVCVASKFMLKVLPFI